jgi:hypothetical protein
MAPQRCMRPWELLDIRVQNVRNNEVNVVQATPFVYIHRFEPKTQITQSNGPLWKSKVAKIPSQDDLVASKVVLGSPAWY